MGIEESRSSDASLRRRLTSGLAEDLFFFGLLALCCLLFIAGSISLHYGVASMAAKLKDELAALPFAVGQAPGTRSILTGTIANDAKPLFKHFVSYVEEMYRSGGKYQTSRGWEASGGERQTFRIDTPSGSMGLARPDYALSPRVSETNKPLLTEWDHEEARIEEPPGAWERARRFRGLVASGPVTAVGTVTPEGTFDADYVIGTALDEVEARLAPIASGETSRFGHWLTFLGFAALALTVALFVRARHRRAAAEDI